LLCIYILCDCVWKDISINIIDYAINHEKKEEMRNDVNALVNLIMWGQFSGNIVFSPWMIEPVSRFVWLR